MTFCFGDYRVNTISLLILFCYSYILLFFDLLIIYQNQKTLDSGFYEEWYSICQLSGINTVGFNLGLLQDWIRYFGFPISSSIGFAFKANSVL